MAPWPEGPVQWAGLEAAVPLTQHDLMSFLVLQIDKLLFGSLKGDLESEDVMPE
jgi:hypothetical protein